MQATPKPENVLMAAAITAFITLGLTAFALQTKYDFTTANGLLTGALLALILVSVVGIFFPRFKLVELAIGGGGAFLFSCFLVVDIQMLMDGALTSSPASLFTCVLSISVDVLCTPTSSHILSCAGHRVQLDPDDYILGALQIYMDIINLFLYILKLINESRRD